MQDSEHLDIALPIKEEERSLRDWRGFLTHLVFQAHGMRLGIELMLCFGCYFALKAVIPWGALETADPLPNLITWMISCTALVVFDQMFLCRSIHVLRHALRLEIAGAFDRALTTLEQVSPESSSFIPCPKPLYHYYRAQMLTNAERFEIAEFELAEAAAEGLSTEQFFIARSKLHRKKGDFEQARFELEEAQIALGKTSLIKLEEAMVILEERENFPAARKAFREVLEFDDVPHPSGETTQTLARAFYEVSQLRTGHAEEGIEGLGLAINQLLPLSRYVETLRPIVAVLLAERSYYLATHREPKKAIVDLAAANKLCGYPSLQKRLEDVREELKWRYNSAE